MTFVKMIRFISNTLPTGANVRLALEVAVASISVAMLTACGGGEVTYLDEKDSRSVTSVGIDYHDIESAADESTRSLLSSRYVISIDKPKVMAISDVVNDTMQNINVQMLTSSITREMQRSGKFRITAATSGSGGTTEGMIRKSRLARGDTEFNQYTTIEKGNLIAPELALSGTIIQKNTRVNNKQRIDYMFIMQLVDLKTGIVEWSNETHITKVTKGNRAAW